MAPSLRVPQVTQQDLLDFHRVAFGRSFTSPPDPSGTVKANDRTLDSEPDLGYYPDGVQRTLTDAQIAIFRHSEVRKLMLERAKISEETNATELSEGEIESDGGHPGGSAQNGFVDATVDTTNVSEPDVDEQDDEQEYAEFLKRERREFVEATQRQRRKQTWRHDDQDRTISTRRKIREMDEQHDSVQTISYDEQDSGLDGSVGHGNLPETSLVQHPEVQGRKIWWPEIGVEPETNLFVGV